MTFQTGCRHLFVEPACTNTIAGSKQKKPNEVNNIAEKIVDGMVGNGRFPERNRVLWAGDIVCLFFGSEGYFFGFWGGFANSNVRLIKLQ